MAQTVHISHIKIDDIRTVVQSDSSQERSGVYRINSKLIISETFSETERIPLPSLTFKTAANPASA